MKTYTGEQLGKMWMENKRKQCRTFERLADGTIRIVNPIVYEMYDRMDEKLQMAMYREECRLYPEEMKRIRERRKARRKQRKTVQ